jgi:hypothetical protein
MSRLVRVESTAGGRRRESHASATVIPADIALFYRFIRMVGFSLLA